MSPLHRFEKIVVDPDGNEIEYMASFYHVTPGGVDEGLLVKKCIAVCGHLIDPGSHLPIGKCGMCGGLICNRSECSGKCEKTSLLVCSCCCMVVRKQIPENRRQVVCLSCSLRNHLRINSRRDQRQLKSRVPGEALMERKP